MSHYEQNKKQVCKVMKGHVNSFKSVYEIDTWGRFHQHIIATFSSKQDEITAERRLANGAHIW